MKLFISNAILLLTIPFLYIVAQPQIPSTLAGKAEEESHFVGMEKC